MSSENCWDRGKSNFPPPCWSFSSNTFSSMQIIASFILCSWFYQVERFWETECGRNWKVLFWYSWSRCDLARSLRYGLFLQNVSISCSLQVLLSLIENYPPEVAEKFVLVWPPPSLVVHISKSFFLLPANFDLFSASSVSRNLFCSPPVIRSSRSHAVVQRWSDCGDCRSICMSLHPLTPSQCESRTPSLLSTAAIVALIRYINSRLESAAQNGTIAFEWVLLPPLTCLFTLQVPIDDFRRLSKAFSIKIEVHTQIFSIRIWPSSLF